MADDVADGAHAPVNEVHQRLRPGEDRLEDRPHQHDEDDGTEDAMRQHAIDRLAPGVLAIARGRVDRFRDERRNGLVAPHDAARPPFGRELVEASGEQMRVGERIGRHMPGQRVILALVQQQRHGDIVTGAVGHGRESRQALRQPVDHALQRRGVLAEMTRGWLDVARHQVAQYIEPGSLGGRDADDRDAQLPLERRDVNAQSLLGGGIHHVEREDNRPAQLDHLQREVQVTVEVRCVHHENDEVRRRRVGLQPEQDVSHHHFIGRRRLQAVAAGQIDHFRAPAVGEIAIARLLLDRHARIVRDLLSQPRERVEQRGLPRVGVAQDRDAPQRGLRRA